MAVTITFRDSGPWGSGKGAPLTIGEMDDNWWALKQAVEAVQSVAFTGESIGRIEVAGGDMSIFGDQGSKFGTFRLPEAAPRPRGAWVAGRRYSVNDLVRHAGAVFQCVAEHVAAADWWNDQRAGRWTWLGGTAAPTPEQLTTGTGPVSVEVPAGGAWVPAMPVRLAAAADPEVVLHGTVTAHGPDDQGVHRLDAEITSVTGSGTYTGWRVALAGPEGAAGPAGPAGRVPLPDIIPPARDLGGLDAPAAVFGGESAAPPVIDLGRGAAFLDLGGL